ncbi:MAG: hypothetical protein ACHQK8_03535 [Bacteroidia bacterium]
MKTIEELKTFFNQDFKILTEKISENSKPVFGTMDAQRMIEHMAHAFKIGNGKFQIPGSEIDPRADKLKIISLLSDRPLPKGFHNPILQKGLLPYENESLEMAKIKLFEEVELLQKLFESNDENFTRVHNVFGRLNYHEWLWFEYKHVMHHFMQFEIIPPAERIN